MTKPIICVLHAAFDADRRKAMARLTAELLPQARAAGVTVYEHHDTAGKGSLGPWLHVLDYATREGGDATHVTVIGDDNILVPHFVETLIKCIEAHPEALLCMQSNHLDAPKAYEQGARWYTTPDGFTGFAGTMPMAWVREHLAWRRENLDGTVPVAGDLGVNLWAMATGRKIYKSLPSLVDHDLTLPSLDGNDHHIDLSPRKPLVWAPENLWALDWTGPVVDLGRTYKGNCWRLMLDVKQERITADLIERMYDAWRGGPISETTHVAICSPTYREPHEIVRATTPSRKAAAEDLVGHDVGVSLIKVHGDSLPSRMRQRAVHEFLKSSATHLLFWDADIESMDPTVVRTMLASGHDVVCGAYPFKATDGSVVLNCWEADAQRFADGGDVPEWLEVMHAGTGFMLISRKCIVDLMARHPELMHISQSRDGDRGAPLWALFDTAVVDMTYLSEDYYFCHLVHQAGGKVWVYTPARFKHYGVYGYEGSLRAQYHEAAE